MSLLEKILKGNTACPEVLELLRNPELFVPVIADEPARWFFEENEKEYWDQVEEFKNIAPPFPIMWFEFKAPKFSRSEVHNILPWDHSQWKQAGVLLVARERTELEPGNKHIKDFPTAKWIVTAFIFMDGEQIIKTLVERIFRTNAERIAKEEILRRHLSLDSEKIKKILDSEVERSVNKELNKIPEAYEMFRYIYGVEENGKMALVANTNSIFLISSSSYAEDFYKMSLEGINHVSNIPTAVLNVALLSTYFMHAKGTELKTKHVSQQLRNSKKNKKKRDKHQLPQVVFKILDIGLGMRQALKEAKSEGGGLSKALHLRRGHFKTFTKPMFGKGKTGDIWIKPHWVGQEEEGKIKKSYRVKKPDEPDMPKQNPVDLDSAETGVFDGGQLTGLMQEDDRHLEDRLSEVINWAKLAEIASEGLPQAHYMLQRALLTEFASSPRIKKALVKALEELMEQADERMIGVKRKLKRHS